jgi:hypothetical protein
VPQKSRASTDERSEPRVRRRSLKDSLAAPGQASFSFRELENGKKKMENGPEPHFPFSIFHFPFSLRIEKDAMPQ